MTEEIKNINRDTEDDAELVKAFQSGNRAAFDKLVLRHKDRVFNLCYRFMGDYQEADDSAQDVFVKVFRSLKRFRLESSFSTWLYRIAVNTCKNRLKSMEYRFRKKIVQLDSSEVPGECVHPIKTADESQSPGAELEKKEMLKAVQKAIDSLPAGQKEVVVLRDIEGLSYEEITNITGYKPGTLKSKLARARLGLRENLRGVI